MMRNFILTLLLVLSTLTGYCQDKLILKTSEVVKCKVVKVGVDVVSYKRADNPDGPVYDVKKQDVSAILYENGTADVFGGTNVNVEDNATVKTDTLSKKIKQEKLNFGLTAGYNASTMLYDDSYKVGSGFNVGLIGILPFAESRVGYVFVEPSVLYSRECSIVDNSNYFFDDSYTGEGNTPISSIEEEKVHKSYMNHLRVPVQCGYEFKLGSVITLGPKVGLEYDHCFGEEYDLNYMNLVEGLNLSYKRKFRLWLGWQGNLRTWSDKSNYSSDWVTFNANIAYLFL